MLFNSLEFILMFLPATLALYFILNRLRLTVASKSLLVAASLFFYCWWDVRYLPLILGSIIFNYSAGTVLARSAAESYARRRAALASGVAANILLLGYYKYTDFFITNTNSLFKAGIPLQHIVLPLGISFFTFTQIAYLVDAYKDRAKEYDLLNYSLFVTFFPHLLAGPIIHHKEMMPQFASMRNKPLNYKHLSMGMYLFSIGIFKKVVIADTLAGWANAGFGPGGPLNLLAAWSASLSYTFQIYFDFSGYTDMALGAALMFNIILPINFNSPYKALDIQDFWRRWHITLSRFLRDYIYIPLGGNRAGEARTYVNILITFLIGGLWHGAGWTFVFWGALHGMAVLLNRAWRRFGFRMPAALAWLLTFNFVNFAWVFFRAKSWDEAIRVLSGMAGLGGIVLPLWLQRFASSLEGRVSFGNWWHGLGSAAYCSTFCIAALLLICLLARNSGEMFARFRPDWRRLTFALALGISAITLMSTVHEFLYFNF